MSLAHATRAILETTASIRRSFTREFIKTKISEFRGET